MPTEALHAVFGVHRIGEATFRGTPTAGPFHRMFGGQLLAQAVCAAGETIASERTVTSVRGTFLREGDCSLPVFYSAQQLLHGRTFSTLRIDAMQNDRLIFTAEVSLQADGAPPSHQQSLPSPDLSAEILRSAPLELPVSSVPTEAGDYRSHFDIRSAEIIGARSSTVPIAHSSLRCSTVNDSQAIWFRLRGNPPDSSLLSSAALAYASDLTVLQLVKKTKANGVNDPGVNAATLSHSLWWHAVPRLNEWLLFFQEAPRTSGIRGLVFGRIYDSSGALIASIAQEGIARPLLT